MMNKIMKTMYLNFNFRTTRNCCKHFNQISHLINILVPTAKYFVKSTKILTFHKYSIDLSVVHKGEKGKEKKYDANRQGG